MITPIGHLSWATQVPGPASKKYPTRNGMSGIALHSMEGSYQSSLGELTNMAREASWMFSLRISGELVQHYAVGDSPWASGNRQANTTLWSVELEGVQPSPINAAQIATLRRLCAEFAELTGQAATREPDHQTLWMHREVWNWASPNAGPTACPSERYAPFFAALTAGEEEAMTGDERKEVDALKGEVAALRTIVDRIDNKGIILYADGQGYDLVAGERALNADVTRLEAEEVAKL